LKVRKPLKRLVARVGGKHQPKGRC